MKKMLKHPIFWCCVSIPILTYCFILCVFSAVDGVKQSGGIKNIIQPLWEGEQNPDIKNNKDE